MATQLEVVTARLAQAIQGENVSSFKSREFLELLDAIKALTSATDISATHTRLVHEQLGLKALQLLLDRMMASMQSERALAMMRDSGEKPC
jgi:hypothetical protein